jgi:hypothetical protein
MKIILVDCLGCIFDESFFVHIEEPGITEADKFRLRYENPNRSLDNQTSTHEYLKSIDDILDKTDYDSLYFVGTNGEVLTATYIIRKENGTYSNPVGYINTLDKFNFAKDFLMNEGEDLIIYTDQYFGQVFEKMCTKFNSKIKIVEIKRNVSDEEMPNIQDILKKHSL